MIELTKEQIKLIVEIDRTYGIIEMINKSIKDGGYNDEINNSALITKNLFKRKILRFKEKLKAEGIIMPDLTTKGEKHDK